MSGLAPGPLTMDRLADKEELIVAQSTSQCCRTGCCQPSINWSFIEADNFQGGNPLELPISGWAHEESSYTDRCCSGCMPGCRETKYVMHSGPPPESIIGKEDYNWCTCQKGLVTEGLTESEQKDSVIATHEKTRTCGACCCGPMPYLETKDAEGKLLGKTEYVCDGCIFIPKFDVFDAKGDKIYRLRPETCVAGLCIKCAVGGPKGKCCRVPFIVRDPNTFEPLKGKKGVERAQVTQLWAGLKNACCTQRDVYHEVFPDSASTAEKLTLIGSSILLDIVFVEQDQGGDS